MKRTEEYTLKCYEIIDKGGFLWAIERTDTNEFLYHHFTITKSHERAPNPYKWSKNLGVLSYVFLTKQDAEEEVKHLGLAEGGCSCCGHGSVPIPIDITEHEFTPPNPKE